MLMAHDRVQSDEFLLTQEFLAMMLRVNRTGVAKLEFDRLLSRRAMRKGHAPRHQEQSESTTTPDAGFRLTQRNPRPARTCGLLPRPSKM